MTTLTHLKRPIFIEPAPRKIPPRLIIVGAGLLALLLIIKLGLPSAAKLADPLRQLVGNEAVAQLETWLFAAQDSAKQVTYAAGLAEPVAPWQVAAVTSPDDIPTGLLASPTPTPTTMPSPTAAPPVIMEDEVVVSPIMTATLLPPTVAPTPAPTAMPSPIPWQPDALTPLGSLAGEGSWSPYVLNPNTDEAVAYRTFLQPDAERPFAVVAVVAFDLTAVDLNFVLGSEEPSLPNGARGNGRIPSTDNVPGTLLAAFNGGFMATHGEYGAMSNELEVLPPKEGLATVAIGQDGRIQIGKWGEDILPDNNWLGWRQNAHLVVENGAITAETEANSLYYWSGSINGEVVTWRSGLGLSADGRTLFYFAGPSLSMPTLGHAMVTAGVDQGMLLDINPYWVHFTTFHHDGEALTAESLLADMEQHVDRFLRMYARDFFYITLSPADQDMSVEIR
jgi:hypothetical protein